MTESRRESVTSSGRDGVAATKRPSARCGICNYVNNLRADGTLGRHHTWIGGRYAGQCPGTGKTPEETAIERRDWEAIVRGE